MTEPVGEFLAPLAKEQLQNERQTRSSLVQRASLVITTSGTLVTLLLGAAALVTKSQSFTAPCYVLIEVTVAVVLFVLAALVALVVNWPWSQRVVKVDFLKRPTYEDDWEQPSLAIRRDAHDDVVSALESYRKTNRWLGWGLMAALTTESGAVVVLALSVLQILFTGL